MLDPVGPIGAAERTILLNATAIMLVITGPTIVLTLEVDVVALDWKWLFIYPGQNVASINKLVVPVGTPLSFRFTSATVMNSFFIPQCGSQIYAMAGMQTRLHLQADKPGPYAGLSAHYSGEGFADMNFGVDTVTPTQFSAWVKNTRKVGPKLDRAAHLTLARTFETAKPSTFSAVAKDIFETAIDEAVAPAHQAAQHSGE